MKKKKKGHHVASALRPTTIPRIRTVHLPPEEIARYVHQAEAHALPVIKELHLPPAMAFFLVAQYTQVLATGDERTTPEGAMSMTATVLALWQGGFYTQGQAYPYTLEETLQDHHDPFQATQDYAESFQPLQTPLAVPPRGKRAISAGLVQHPETQLWQIWFIIDGPCDQLAAYRDASKAQRGLQEIMTLLRTGGTSRTLQALCQRLEQQSDGAPKQLPFDMIQYLLEHLDRYMVHL